MRICNRTKIDTVRNIVGCILKGEWFVTARPGGIPNRRITLGLVSVGPLLVIGRLTFQITHKLFLRARQDDILAKYQFCNGCNTVSSTAEIMAFKPCVQPSASQVARLLALCRPVGESHR
jgi:hypothetical protein